MFFAVVEYLTPPDYKTRNHSSTNYIQISKKFMD